MSRRRLIGLGLLVFFATLVWRAPAATLYGWMAGSDGASAIAISGIEGTLSTGKAQALSYRQRPLLQDFEWRLKPLWLLLGRPAAGVRSAEGVLVDGNVQLRPLGDVVLSDFRLNGPLKPILAAIGQPFLPVDAQLGANIAKLRLDDGFPESASGNLNVQGLAWKLGREPVLLGDYEAIVVDDKENIAVTIRSLAGALDVSGDAHLNRDRTWDVHLQLRAKAGAAPAIVNLLPSLGQPDTQGFYHLRRSGNLAPQPGAAPVPKIS